MNDLTSLLGESRTAKLADAIRRILRRGMTQAEWQALNDAMADAAVADKGGTNMSENGIAFLYDHEAVAGVSNRLHWPGGASGVTLGAGYDLKARARAGVVADLMQIGLASEVARKAADGAGLTGSAARAFCAKHRDLIALDRSQEMALLVHVVPAYEAIVRRFVKVPLTQNQYDALVSFTYNIGGGAFQGSTALKRLNAGDYAGAADAMKFWNKSGGKVMQGLVNRRNHEVALFRKAG